LDPEGMEKNTLIADRDWRNPSACGLIGIMNRKGSLFGGEMIMQGIACLRERSNGLGGGFAAYGIYPENKDDYAFHVLCGSLEAKKNAEDYLRQHYKVIRDEAIPTYPLDAVKNPPILWRYFLQPILEMRIFQTETEADFVVRTVMELNQKFPRTFVASSGKNMGIFKGLGYPEDIAAFFRLEKYQGYLWTAMGHPPWGLIWEPVCMLEKSMSGVMCAIFNLGRRSWSLMRTKKTCRKWNRSLKNTARISIFP